MNQNAKIAWDYLMSKIQNQIGVAGLLGNLYAESGLQPTNLQDTYNKAFGLDDEAYTRAVDNGAYENFVNDSAGYGLAQWTWWSRKKNLLDFATSRGTSIGNIYTQLEFLWDELSSYGLTAMLRGATSIRSASDEILTKFERPLDQSDKMKEIRAQYGQQFYDEFANEDGENTMSNSSMVCHTHISPNKYSPRAKPIDRITIHCVVGQASPEALGHLFADPKRYASSNYGVGPDGRIGMFVEEKDCSWCSSSRLNDDRAVTIETASDNFHPYAVTDAAYAALLDLCEDICRRNGKRKLLWIADKDKALAYEPATDEMVLTVHRWFANKSCPGEYLYSRQGQIAEEVTRRLQEDDEEMTYDQFKEYMNQYREELQAADGSDWSQDDCNWAISSGLIQGGGNVNGKTQYMFRDFMTREQLAAVLHRFAKKIGKE